MLLKKIAKLSQVLGLLAMIVGLGTFSYMNASMAEGMTALIDDDDQKKRGKGGDQRGNRGKNRGRGGDDDDDRRERGRNSQRDSDRESRRQQKESDQNSRRQQRSSDNESRRQQNESDQNSRRQQRGSDRESRRQQRQSDQNSRGQQERNYYEALRQQQISNQKARRQQENSDRESRRQQEWSDRNSRKQQRNSDRESRRQQAQSVWFSQRQQNNGTERDRDNNRTRNNRARRMMTTAPLAYFGQIFNGSPVYRVDDRRLNREQQRAMRRQRQVQRQYQQNQSVYNRNQYDGYSAPAYGYDQNNNYQEQSAYNGGTSWKSQILPMLIASIFGGGGFDERGGGYPVQGYYGSPTTRNGYDYNNRQPAYSQSSVYSPYSYEPSYNNYGSNDPDAYDQQGFDTGSLLNSLPIAEIIERYTGENEFVSGLIGSFLTQGYDHGRVAGEVARQNGYTEAQYHDPYTYENGAYDPHSVSLGENRRYLSEGYEQGYRDALAGNENYERPMSSGSDLIGVLLNSMISGV